MEVLLKILMIFFDVIQVVVAIYILIPFSFSLIYIFVKLFHINTAYSQKKSTTDRDFEFGIIITAHQDTEFIGPLIDSIEKQSFKNYYAYIVADDCDTTSLNFQSERIRLLKPASPLHSKVRSIQYAITSFTKDHDAIIILDADNLIHPAFLEVMNKYFQMGYKVVQAGFKPKNTSSNFARMDAIGDLFNFFIEREVRMMIGLSATIWGSGIAIDYEIYKEVKYSDFLGGFDKKLQAHLVQRVDKIAYAPDAILYDEKVSTGTSLENQRTRWIHSYFKYFKECFEIFINGFKKGSFNLVYFGFNTLRPPLFIILGIAFLITAIDHFINQLFYHGWIFFLLSFFVSFLFIVIIKGKDRKYVKTIFLLPLFVARQVLALFKIKKANTSFLKTEHHNIIYIDELLKSEHN